MISIATVFGILFLNIDYLITMVELIPYSSFNLTVHSNEPVPALTGRPTTMRADGDSISSTAPAIRINNEVAYMGYAMFK